VNHFGRGTNIEPFCCRKCALIYLSFGDKHWESHIGTMYYNTSHHLLRSGARLSSVHLSAETTTRRPWSLTTSRRRDVQAEIHCNMKTASVVLPAKLVELLITQYTTIGLLQIVMDPWFNQM
jgi:hypothetical protein